MLYVQQQYLLHAHSSMLWMYLQKQVSTLALPDLFYGSKTVLIIQQSETVNKTELAPLVNFHLLSLSR